jgi:alkanesulfonate monooxygenase SsuD/methylene tetrahydromethanopterin reductase-like flavin-dependent oxidoreductase (luciferase family)
MRGTGFALRDPWPWWQFAEVVRAAEDGGYRAVFLPEIAGRDTLAALAALAGETRQLGLGTGVVPMGSRSPVLTAMAAATVHERSRGRAVLGLGTGPAVPGALARLESLVGTVRSLLDGKEVELEGRRVRLSLAPASPLPVWISALGPRALTLAGRIGDGVLLNWCTPERVAEAAAAVRASAEAAGRDAAELTVAAYVRANLGADPAVALEAMRAAAGEYASYPAYARQFALMGLGPQAEAAAAAHRTGRPGDVPEALVHAIASTGEAGPARERLEAYRQAGADLPIVYPVVGAGALTDLRGTLDRLAPQG